MTTTRNLEIEFVPNALSVQDQTLEVQRSFVLFPNSVISNRLLISVDVWSHGLHHRCTEDYGRNCSYRIRSPGSGSYIVDYSHGLHHSKNNGWSTKASGVAGSKIVNSTITIHISFNFLSYQPSAWIHHGEPLPVGGGLIQGVRYGGLLQQRRKGSVKDHGWVDTMVAMVATIILQKIFIYYHKLSPN